MVVKHKGYSIPNSHGGFTTGTYCNRSRVMMDGMNIADRDAAVTCKLCLKIMADPKHWMHRRAKEGAR